MPAVRARDRPRHWIRRAVDRLMGVNVRIIWLTLFELFGSLRRSDDEDLAGGVHDVRVEGVELVDVHDAGDLGHELFDEAEVAAGERTHRNSAK